MSPPLGASTQGRIPADRSPHRLPEHKGRCARVWLEVIRERCAEIDVHKRQVTIHVQVPGYQETREFATDTRSLLGMVDWLRGLRTEHVAMEGTGSHWKPVYNILEASGLQAIIGNASHMKAVPGRKTDAKICTAWPPGFAQPTKRMRGIRQRHPRADPAVLPQAGAHRVRTSLPHWASGVPARVDAESARASGEPGAARRAHLAGREGGGRGCACPGGRYVPCPSQCDGE